MKKAVGVLFYCINDGIRTCMLMLGGLYLRILSIRFFRVQVRLPPEVNRILYVR